MKARLAQIEAGRSVRTLRLGEQPVTLGRDDACDLQVVSERVSRSHAANAVMFASATHSSDGSHIRSPCFTIGAGYQIESPAGSGAGAPPFRVGLASNP